MTGPAVYLAMADRALSGARLLVEMGDTEGACSRAYYAMFAAARAALIVVGADVPDAVFKTHAGLISAFGRHVVQSGRLDAEYGRSLNRLQRLRLIADYLGDPPPTEQGRSALAQAEAFVEAVARLIP